MTSSLISPHEPSVVFVQLTCAHFLNYLMTYLLSSGHSTSAPQTDWLTWQNDTTTLILPCVRMPNSLSIPIQTDTYTTTQCKYATTLVEQWLSKVAVRDVIRSLPSYINETRGRRRAASRGAVSCDQRCANCQYVGPLSVDNCTKRSRTVFLPPSV